jgi:two-component system sensor kinase FixL
LQRSRLRAAASTRETLALEAHLQSILDTVPDAMMVIESPASSNRSARQRCDCSGTPLQRSLEKDVKMLMLSPYREEHDRYLARYLQTGERRIIGIGQSRWSLPSVKCGRAIGATSRASSAT